MDDELRRLDIVVRYEAQIAQAIPVGDVDLRAAIISAITLGITVSRHLINPTNSPPPTRRRLSGCCVPACFR